MAEKQMDVIKKIKQAESEAQEIIERAKAEGAKRAEQWRSNRLERLAQAEVERKKAVESAISAARSQGLAEAENLKAKAERERQPLREKAAERMAGAATKVMDYLRG